MKSTVEILKSNFANIICGEDVLEAAEKSMNQQSIDFGGWLLANCDVVLDSDDAWIWEFLGTAYNTKEMFEIYLKDNDSNN